MYCYEVGSYLKLLPLLDDPLLVAGEPSTNSCPVAVLTIFPFASKSWNLTGIVLLSLKLALVRGGRYPPNLYITLQFTTRVAIFPALSVDVAVYDFAPTLFVSRDGIVIVISQGVCWFCQGKCEAWKYSHEECVQNYFFKKRRWWHLVRLGTVTSQVVFSLSPVSWQVRPILVLHQLFVCRVLLWLRSWYRLPQRQIVEIKRKCRILFVEIHHFCYFVLNFMYHFQTSFTQKSLVLL